MQDKKFNFSRLVLLFFQGAIIGTGAILPGISGGVLCVAFGLYEPMVGLFAHPWQSLRRNYQLFLPLFLGGGLGFLLLARVVEHLLTAAAAITLALFAGLICGTIPSLMKKSELSGPNTGWGSFVISLSLSYFLFHLLDSSAGGSIQPNWGWYFFCGCRMGLQHDSAGAEFFLPSVVFGALSAYGRRNWPFAPPRSHPPGAWI